MTKTVMTKTEMTLHAERMKLERKIFGEMWKLIEPFLDALTPPERIELQQSLWDLFRV